jgi:uncharacterized protein YuzE
LSFYDFYLNPSSKRRAKGKQDKKWQMEENLMEDFKVFYDVKEDILYLAKEGEEEDVVELSPGVNVELDESGKLIGVEVFKASSLFKDVIKLMEKRLQAA